MKKTVNGCEYYFAKIVKDHALLKKDLSVILEKVILAFPWPKTMRWDSTNVAWVRPMRNILCIFAGDILPICFGSLVANNISFGHRFLAPGSFVVKDFKDYEKKLHDHKVILSQASRRKMIEEQAYKILSELGLSIIPDESLFDEILGLVEYPVVLLGSIDKKFMRLPKEILSTSIRVHQKYFSLQDSDGNMAPYFITVSNNDPADKSLIIAGNESVLKARLYDAEFFFEEDKKISLENRMPDLANVIFHKKIGSVLDKVTRMKEVAGSIARFLEIKNIEIVERAALLSKADLLTNIVSEFPELQGVAGKYYALHSKEDRIVAEAIYEHYLPRGRHDQCPTFLESSIVSLAEKIDSIVGFFSINEAPTSSKDPYGLRRSALGVIRILIESRISMNIDDLIEKSVASYKTHSVIANVGSKVHEFFYERFKFFLKSEFNNGFITSVFNRSEGNIYLDFKKISALSKFFAVRDGSVDCYLASKRVNNIVASTKDIMCSFDSSLLVSDVEKAMFLAAGGFEKKTEQAFIENDFLKVLQELSNFSVLVNEFFDKTMVMDDDHELRGNRLALLRRLALIFNRMVDFEVIEV